MFFFLKILISLWFSMEQQGDPKREQLMRASDSKIDYPSDDDDDDEHKGILN